MMKNFLAYQKIYASLKISDTKMMQYVVFLLSLMAMFVFSPLNLFMIAVFASNIQSEKYKNNIEVMALLPCSKKHDCYYYYFTGLFAIIKNFFYAMMAALCIYLVLSLWHMDVSNIFLYSSYDSRLMIYRAIGLFTFMFSFYLILIFFDRMFHTSKRNIVANIILSMMSLYLFYHSFENEMVYIGIMLFSGISIVLIPWLSYQLEKRRDKK